MAVKVGINGFGRIGRNILRTALNHSSIEFVAVNDLTDAKMLPHLLQYDPAQHLIIADSSCTTICVAPLAKVVHDKFTIQSGTMTPTHCYTNYQVILDFPHKDLRGARPAALSMIPTSAGAAKALHLVIP